MVLGDDPAPDHRVGACGIHRHPLQKGVYWPELICKDKTIDRKRIKRFKKELQHWGFCFWKYGGSVGLDMFTEREFLISQL